MAKKKEVVAVIKLQAPGGQATPAPPIGPALGQHGVNIGQFVQQFNAATGNLNGMRVTVELSVYSDKSFTFKVKSPPASVLLKDALKAEKGSGTPNKQKIGTITRAQLREIAQRKLPDLNCTKIESAERIVAGTARSMGVEIAD
ncbi:MAG: 50S ribosomal protein L11 [Phycisphaerae bacterium]|nr:MAG: 50S ribosomal protein L11 [Planctomycetota bacterium]KAB2949257.1 MAG: 50S ribosomal protein L11 [Phycisphaerae bacterium]MBE7455676.1 50S ribosomal protein L11 [Planctomycetia bacterium]MCK6463312.1 50S ribosomal protein L11 [Phycisphaerae bacterium]MCL4716934.1 50S ribosomal protein L11 [Phycisphaerae bacterium]